MSMQGKRPQLSAKGERSRAAILEAAVAQFADHGYRGASLASVAAAANLTQQGLLHHFRSKEELLMALIEQRDQADGKRLSALVTEDGLALLDVLDALVAHNQKTPDDVRFFMTLVGEGTSASHPAQDYFVDRYQRIRGRILRSLRDAQNTGGIRTDVDLDALAPVIVAVMDGLQIQWLLDPDIDMTVCFEAFVGLLRDQLSQGAGHHGSIDQPT